MLAKAYGPGGVFHARPGMRRARAYQMLAASWAAAREGSLGRALGLYFKSLAVWPGSLSGKYQRLRWPRARLLSFFARAAAGRRPAGGALTEG